MIPDATLQSIDIKAQLESIANKVNQIETKIQSDESYKKSMEEKFDLMLKNQKKMMEQYEAPPLARAPSKPSFSEFENDVEQRIKKIEFESKSKQPEAYKICLTGGPCAGKTTAISKITDSLKEKGYIVYSVPEAATLIFNSASEINFASFTSEMKINFQFYLMMIQMSLEDSLLGIATNGIKDKNVVLLCDRGTMDGFAYMEKREWEQLLSEHEINLKKIRDQRYDLIIHITTAADGAEEFYGNANNATRKEDIEFARFIDKRLEEAWIEHPNFVQINNKFPSFELKIQSILMTVYKHLGIEAGLDFYNKYLVANPNGQLEELLEKEYAIKLYTCKITDMIFFKDESHKELTYFRKRVV